MRRIHLIAAFTAAVSCIAGGLFAAAHAADKGGPPLKIDANREVKAKSWTGCYADVGGAGFFADGNDTVKAFAIGAGCDYQIDSRFVIGIGGAYIIGTDDTKAIDALVRVGLLLNPNLLIYGRAGLMMDGDKINFSDSIGTVGAGLETSISSSVTIGAEAFTGIKGWGDYKEAPDNWTGRAFLRYKF